MIYKADETNFYQLMNSNRLRLSVVDFYADWCGPCQQALPVLKRLSEKHKHVLFVQVDNDACPDLSTKIGVESLPTILFVKNNKTVHTILGYYENLEQKIEEQIKIHTSLL